MAIKTVSAIGSKNPFAALPMHSTTLLHDAARRCDPTLVQILLEHRSEIDERDCFGKTALTHAVVRADVPDPNERRGRIKGRRRTVQVLLEAGADPSAQGS